MVYHRCQSAARSNNGNLTDSLWNQAIAPVPDANLVAQEVTTVQDIASEQEVQDNNDDSEEEQYANDGRESESESESDSDDDDDTQKAIRGEQQLASDWQHNTFRKRCKPT